MMDMGFWPDVQKIVGTLPPERQTLLFSATMPGEILKLARDVLRMPHLPAGRRQSRRGADDQAFDRAAAARREDRLARALRAPRRDRPGARVRAHEDRRRSGRASAAGQAHPRRGAARRSHAAGTARRRSRASAPASIPCSSPPTSPRAASTSKASRTSSISKCRTRRKPTCTASAARAAPAPKATPSRSSPPTSNAPGRRWRNELDSSFNNGDGPPRAPAGTAQRRAAVAGGGAVPVVPLAQSRPKTARPITARIATCCRWPAPPGSSPTPGAPTALSTRRSARRGRGPKRRRIVTRGDGGGQGTSLPAVQCQSQRIPRGRARSVGGPGANGVCRR